MVYRTINELSALIRTNLYKVPHDINLVVGVPRSGMLPAMMIALYLNKKVTDLDSFIAGRIFESGERSQYIKNDEVKKVLIVDDSISEGGAIKKAKQKIQEANLPYEYTFLVPIISSRGKELVDIYMEIIDDDRVFEWNLFHHGILKYACLDIDGVLNEDPAYEMDDDGPNYIHFLKNAKPLFIPTAPVDTLISCRLEKYRQYTEEWLQKYNIQYKNLEMLDLPSKAERVKWNKHGEYKAQYYKEHNDLYLFIESSKEQAQIIADYTRKPVICLETNSIVQPINRVSVFKKIRKVIRNRCPKMYNFIKRYR